MQTAARLVPTRTVVVWTGLVLATLAFWIVGAHHAGGSRTVASVAILLVAFIKVRFVAAHFMETREAPTVLRVLVEGWCALVCALVLMFYLAA